MSLSIDVSVYLYAQEHNFNEALTSYAQLNSLIVWTNILFKDIDKNTSPPKHYYVFMNSLYETHSNICRGDNYRDHCFNKAKRFTKRDDFESNVKLDYDMTPIEFYKQFSHDELKSIGI